MNIRIRQDYEKIDIHIKNDLKKYIILIIIFFVGIIIGGIYFNSIKGDASIIFQITDLIENAVGDLLDVRLNSFNRYLFEDLKKIFLLTIISSSMIGLPILLVYDMYTGITLSFTVASIIYTYGILKGNIISLLLLFIPNLSLLCGIILVTVSSGKLIENIFKIKKSLKMEMARHLLMCFLAFIIIFLGFLCRIFSITLLGNVLI